MSIKATVNPAAETTETTETTKEEQIADARENETALLDGLLAAADFKTSEECIKNVVISRNGKDLFSFHIHPLSEEDYNSCRKKFTKFVKSKVQGGIRVPEELSIIGFDNIETTNYTDPPLTTVFAPTFDMGFMAARQLFDTFKHNENISPIKILLPCFLIERNSCI